MTSPGPNGAIAALFRYPIKGFTPQTVDRAKLEPGRAFPGDRLFAVEQGPSDFDPAAPEWKPKRHFAVLAHLPEVAGVRLECEGEVMRASADGAPAIEVRPQEAGDREAFSQWLQQVLGEAAGAPLKVLYGRGFHFLDHPLGHVSVLNLESLRDLERRTGRSLDPARLRANVLVEGWPAFAENDWAGREMTLGGARVRVFEPITRCAAPDVDPQTAQRDFEFTAELHSHYGHLLMGIYVQVEAAGEVAPGGVANLL